MRLFEKNNNNNPLVIKFRDSILKTSVSLFSGAAMANAQKLQVQFNTIFLSYDNNGKKNFIVISKNAKENSVDINAYQDKHPFTNKQKVADNGSISKGFEKDFNILIGNINKNQDVQPYINNSNFLDSLDFGLKTFIALVKGGKAPQNSSFFTFNEQEIQKLHQQAETNFKQSITKHPYLEEIAKAAENEMTGNKYTSVGKPSYVREAYDYLVKKTYEVTRALKESGDPQKLLEAAATEEGTVAKGTSIIEKIYKNKDSQKWEDRDFVDAVKAARKGDQSAIGYLMYKHAPAIFNSYWKNYLGPDRKMRHVKIMNDGGYTSSLYKWIGIALKALIEGGVESKTKTGKDRSKLSTLEGFDEKKVTGKPENAFAAHFKLDLMSQATDINKEETRGGVTMSDSEAADFGTTSLDWDDGDQKTTEEMTHADDTFNAAMRSMEDGDFKESWFDFCQDEELNSGNKKCSRAAAFKILLQNVGETNLSKLADKAGVARGTYLTLVKDATNILEQYGIGQSALYRAIDQYGGEKLASYLDAQKMKESVMYGDDIEEHVANLEDHIGKVFSEYQNRPDPKGIRGEWSFRYNSKDKQITVHYYTNGDLYGMPRPEVAFILRDAILDFGPKVPVKVIVKTNENPDWRNSISFLIVPDEDNKITNVSCLSDGRDVDEVIQGLDDPSCDCKLVRESTVQAKKNDRRLKEAFADPGLSNDAHKLDAFLKEHCSYDGVDEETGDLKNPGDLLLRYCGKSNVNFKDAAIRGKWKLQSLDKVHTGEAGVFRKCIVLNWYCEDGAIVSPKAAFMLKLAVKQAGIDTPVYVVIRLKETDDWKDSISFFMDKDGICTRAEYFVHGEQNYGDIIELKDEFDDPDDWDDEYDE